nr:methyl-accepting chemotaxis protein [Burkholderia metallica]
MSELILLVQRNADHVRQAAEFANATSLAVDTSVAAVEQMRGAMGVISASSEKIVDFTTLIEGIAFQTNILALNAAVEAARAGERARLRVCRRCRGGAQPRATGGWRGEGHQGTGPPLGGVNIWRSRTCQPAGSRHGRSSLCDPSKSTTASSKLRNGSAAGSGKSTSR